VSGVAPGILNPEQVVVGGIKLDANGIASGIGNLRGITVFVVDDGADSTIGSVELGQVIVAIKLKLIGYPRWVFNLDGNASVVKVEIGGVALIIGDSDRSSRVIADR
jgi:hypothetical protein